MGDRHLTKDNNNVGEDNDTIAKEEEVQAREGTARDKIVAEGEWWQNQWGKWQWFPKTSTSTASTTTNDQLWDYEGDDETSYMQTQFGGASS